MLKKVIELKFDKKLDVCEDEKGTKISILRPSVLSKRFQSYDATKNFQIWMSEEDREFRPNHLRVFIDLNLRIRSIPEIKKSLLRVFDNIFYGKDPDEEIKIIKEESFEHHLNSLQIIANLSQLFIIEQSYGYNKISNFDPSTLFFQGWVRQFIVSPKEIDNLCMSVCNGQPPESRFTNKENRKNKKYEENLPSLWYLQ